jgi:hypothetical protein
VPEAAGARIGLAAAAAGTSGIAAATVATDAATATGSAREATARRWDAAATVAGGGPLIGIVLLESELAGRAVGGWRGTG